MRTIWKFPLEVTDLQTIQMPVDAHFLSVGQQDDELMLWALVDPENQLIPTTFAIYGTGHPIGAAESDEYHVGTVQVGPYVWHVFYVFDEHED